MNRREDGAPGVVPILSAKGPSPSPEYRNAVRAAYEEVHSAAQRVFDAIVSVAFAGEWRDESAQHAVGEVIAVTPDDFRGSKDKHVRLLLRAYDALSLDQGDEEVR
jgi:hypothetical protein